MTEMWYFAYHILLSFKEKYYMYYMFSYCTSTAEKEVCFTSRNMPVFGYSMVVSSSLVPKSLLYSTDDWQDEYCHQVNLYTVNNSCLIF